jgi:toxin YoeB
MRVVLTPHGWTDHTHWLTADRNNVKRINRLIDDTLRDPFTGIGKPEQLRHALTGAWSRRITGEHRLVYLVDGDDLVIIQARYRYG